MLYDLITSDQEVFNAFYYGVEGVNYKIIDGQIENLAPDDLCIPPAGPPAPRNLIWMTMDPPADLPDIRLL